MICELYQKKINLFEELEELSVTMAEFSPEQLAKDDGQGDLFLNLLDRRTVLIAKIDQLTEQILPLEEKTTPNSRLNELKQELQKILQNMQSLNGIIEVKVKTSLNQIRDQAKKLQDGKQSNRAYVARTPATEGSFIDKRR